MFRRTQPGEANNIHQSIRLIYRFCLGQLRHRKIIELPLIFPCFRYEFSVYSGIIPVPLASIKENTDIPSKGTVIKTISVVLQNSLAAS